MANEARSANDGRRVSVDRDGVFEITAGRNPADDGWLRRYLGYLQAAWTQRRIYTQTATVFKWGIYGQETGRLGARIIWSRASCNAIIRLCEWIQQRNDQK